MCCNAPSRTFSRLALLLGLACIVMQTLSIFTGAWVVTREVLRPQPHGEPEPEPEAPYTEEGMNVQLRVGLLRTCARLERINASAHAYPASQQPPCSMPSLSLRKEITGADLHINNGYLEITPQIITKLRQHTLVLAGMSLPLMFLGLLVTTVAHCNRDFKLGILVACYLFVFAGLLQCLAVVTLPTLMEVPHRVEVSMRVPAHKLIAAGEPFTWEHVGLSYWLGVGVFALTQAIAAVLVTAFVKRFSSMEVMVREIVPGADRKLREHQAGLWEIYPGRAARQLGCISLPGSGAAAMTCYGKVPVPVPVPEPGAKSKPDICSSNPESSADSLHLQEQGKAQGQGQEPCRAEAQGQAHGQDDQLRPLSPFDPAAPRGVSVSLGQPMSLTAGAGVPVPADIQDVSLAGVSVPITVMRGRPLGQQHRTIPCGVVLDEAAPMDTFPSYGAPVPGVPGGAAPGGALIDGTMTVARRKCSSGSGAGAPEFSTLDNRRCKPQGQGQGQVQGQGQGPVHGLAHNTLPHPPRQF